MDSSAYVDTVESMFGESKKKHLKSYSLEQMMADKQCNEKAYGKKDSYFSSLRLTDFFDRLADFEKGR